MSHPVPDRPIDGTSSNPDLLHRKEFSERIAKALTERNSDDCLIASLEGAWGTGKTSVIEMMCKYYESTGKPNSPLVFRFNPWMFSGTNNLIKDFLIQFATELKIGNSGKKLKQVGNELLKYSSIFDVIKLVPGAEPWTSIIQSVYKSVGKSASDIGELKALSVEKQKKKISEHLVKSQKAILVIIDDIDRLVPEEIFTIFQLVKSISDFSKVTYLLSYEHKHIASSLEKRGVPDPSQFIEKIVQLRLSLPRTSQEDLVSLLNLTLKDFGESEKELGFPGEQERWQNFAFEYLLPILRTPRDFVRLANRLRINYPLVNGELSFSDYCGIELLGVIAPELYDHIKSNPLAYIGTDPQDIFATRDQVIQAEKSNRDNAINSIKDQHSIRLIGNLIKHLFPQINKDTNDTYRSEIPPRSSGRIANPDNFEFAFYFSRPHHLVQLSDIREIWFNPTSRRRVFDVLSKQKGTKRILSAIDELIFDPSNKHLAQDWGEPKEVINFIDEYITFTQSPNLPDTIGGFFEFDYEQYISRLTHWLINRKNKSERLKLAKAICTSSNSIFVGAQIVIRNLREHGHFENKEKDANPTFTERQSASVNNLWRKTCIDSLKTDKLWNNRFLSQIYDVLIHLSASRTLTSVIKNPKLSEKYRYPALIAALSKGSINGEQYLTVDREWKFKKLNFTHFAELARKTTKPRNVSIEAFNAFSSAYHDPSGSYSIRSGKNIK